MELTITQNGALYALQHRPARRYRGNLQKRADADRISGPYRRRPYPKKKSPPEDTGEQGVDAFFEYRALHKGWALFENPPMRTVVGHRAPKTLAKESELIRAVQFGVPANSASAAIACKSEL